jgi:FMN reductase
MFREPLIVGFGGTTRALSTSERALRRALDHAEQQGCATRLFGGPDLPAKFYLPENPSRGKRAVALVEALRGADGIIIASPGYHGSVSGLVKNALDYAEDLRGDARPYFEGRAVGLIVTADGPQALGSTLATLRAVTHALRGWPTPYAALINTSRPDTLPEQLKMVEIVASQVARFATRMRDP